MPSKFAYLSLCRSMQLLVLLARGEAAKDLEILVLRHQLAVLRRQAPRPRFQPADRALPAAISRSLPDRAHWSCFLVRPETLLRWHRWLVAGAWTSPHRRTGRPPLDQKLQQLIVQVHLAGVTSNPDGVWVAKQARNLLLVPGERGRRVHFLVRDRDARFCRGFDDVFGSQGRQVLVTLFWRHGLTPTRSAGCGPSAPSAWTGCCSSAAATWSRSCGSTPSTTTATVRIGRSGWSRRTHPPISGSSARVGQAR